MGRRPELVGGGLIRSLGGWDGVKKVKPLKSRGVNSEEVLQKGTGLIHREMDYIIGKGGQRDRVGVRDLLCYWCAVERRCPWQNWQGGWT